MRLPTIPRRLVAFRAMAALAPVGIASALVTIGAAPALASREACQRDAIIILQKVREARAGLNEAATGSQRARCAAWRAQVVALKKAAAFYGRCQTGPERARNVANANAGVAEYQGAVSSQCGGR